MILATLRMIMPPDKKLESINFLKWIAEQTRSMSGCLSFRIYHDEEEEDFLMVEELWNNQEDLDWHLQSKNYLNMLLLAETARQAPEIKFQTITESAGLEMVERARGVNRNNKNDGQGNK